MIIQVNDVSGSAGKSWLSSHPKKSIFIGKDGNTPHEDWDNQHVNARLIGRSYYQQMDEFHILVVYPKSEH